MPCVTIKLNLPTDIRLAAKECLRRIFGSMSFCPPLSTVKVYNADIGSVEEEIRESMRVAEDRDQYLVIEQGVIGTDGIFIAQDDDDIPQGRDKSLRLSLAPIPRFEELDWSQCP